MHTDHLGSTVVVTDRAGNTVWNGEYTPFGKQVGQTGDLKRAAKFTGKDLDEDIGLYYFNARWYDQEIGRFISEDPVQDGVNWFAYCNNNPLRYIDPSGLIYYEADKETGEMYAVFEKGDSYWKLGKEVYGSGKAGYEIAKINEVEDPNKVTVGQRVRLEALEGFSNDKYSQMLKGSFLMGDLSYNDLVKNKVTGLDFTDKEKWFIRRHALNVQKLYDEGTIDKKTYMSEIDRLGGYFYDDAFGNAQSFKVKNFASWKKGIGMEFNAVDEQLLGVASGKLLGGEIGLKWSFPGMSYDGEKVKQKSMGLSLKAEYYLGSLSVDVPVGPVEVTLGGKVGAGGSLKLGYIPGSKDNRFFGISASMGFGVEIGVKPRD